MKRRGFIMVLSSPSGGGKSTLARMLMAKDDNLAVSISATTRDPRKGEVDGKDYYFLTKENFNQKIENDEFLEYEEVFGNFYGTPKKPVDDLLNSGVDVIFDIDWQGTRRITSKVREDVASVFILPPTMEELERRLCSRGTDDEETINRRMARSTVEISHWDEYDYVMVNHDLEESLLKVNHILKAERLRRIRQHTLSHFTNNLINQHNAT
jgi:guanylate kinase